jgi:hypothetical protein
MQDGCQYKIFIFNILQRAMPCSWCSFYQSRYKVATDGGRGHGDNPAESSSLKLKSLPRAVISSGVSEATNIIECR